MLAAYDQALAPVPTEWLAERLRLLWKSSPVNGSLDATAWVHETGRLLMDIPQDILATAIDEAVKKSERGFMPTIGEIRKIAEPRLRDLRLERWRLEQVVAHEEPKTAEPEPRCTPEEADRIRREVGIKYPDDGATRPADYIPVEQRTAPDREWYLRHGYDPDALNGEERAA